MKINRFKFLAEMQVYLSGLNLIEFLGIEYKVGALIVCIQIKHDWQVEFCVAFVCARKLIQFQ